MNIEQTQDPNFQESMRTRLVRAALVGGVALGLVGCAAPDQEESGKLAVPGAIYMADEGVNAWAPLASIETDSAYGYDNDLINTTAITGAVQRNANQSTSGSSTSTVGESDSAYSWLTNTDPITNELSVDHRLPSGSSAPVLSVKMASDGTLRVEDHIGDNDTEQIRDAIIENDDTLIAAFNEGEVHAVHVRIFEPKAPGSPFKDYEPVAMYIPEDSNEAGKPSVYYYLPAHNMDDADKLRLVIGHETQHGMFDTLAQDTLTASERTIIGESCVALRTAAQSEMSRFNGRIAEGLETAATQLPEAYRPSVERVIDAIETNQYDSLPKDMSNTTTRGLPECYWQSPYRAVIASIQSDGLTFPDIRTLPGEGVAFQEAVNRATESWNVYIKSFTVYSLLSESALLSYSTDNEKWGHPYDNAGEWLATMSNMIEQEPEATGAAVSQLPAEQRDAIMASAEVIRDAQIRNHPDDEAYTMAVNDAHEVFANAVAG